MYCCLLFDVCIILLVSINDVVSNYVRGVAFSQLDSFYIYNLPSAHTKSKSFFTDFGIMYGTFAYRKSKYSSSTNGEPLIIWRTHYRERYLVSQK